jgi:hypothetical protein
MWLAGNDVLMNLGVVRQDLGLSSSTRTASKMSNFSRSTVALVIGKAAQLLSAQVYKDVSCFVSALHKSQRLSLSVGSVRYELASSRPLRG